MIVIPSVTTFLPNSAVFAFARICIFVSSSAPFSKAIDKGYPPTSSQDTNLPFKVNLVPFNAVLSILKGSVSLAKVVKLIPAGNVLSATKVACKPNAVLFIILIPYNNI